LACSECGFENSAGMKFCGQCGAGLEKQCAQCDATNSPEFRFCGQCGSELDAAPGTVSGVAPAPRIETPSTFASDRYRILRPLGEGAKKRVYLARDSRLDRDVALALIKVEGLDEAGRARVRREAQAMGRLGDHPSIVTVFDTGDEDGQPFIVSEFMSRGDLETRLLDAEDHRLPLAEAIPLALQICAALEHAHGNGIIHRDLKPGNIWLGEDGAARLGDFGLALTVERSRLTQEGVMVGTVAYMPPEQALGRAPDARSDLYALGATLYEMVAGRPPFLGDDVVSIISQHINTPPVAPSWHNAEVSKPLEAVILALLEKDPERRPKSAAELRRRLQQSEAATSRTSAAADSNEVNPLDRLASGVFVGRDEQVEKLRNGLDEALSGKGGILLLVGEPGIGKTRTAEELATYASMRGAQVLWGRCYEGDGAPAYWPWVQIIRSYVHDREPKALLSQMGPGAADIAEVVSEVRECLPGLPAPPRLEAEQSRFRLFDSITTFLKNASAAHPLVLVLDDLHWSDKPSLLLFQFIARELASARILILGTYRDVEVGRQHPLEQTLAEFARSGTVERVLLRGLTEADVGRFIELTAGKAPPTALFEAVYRETEGNPFFIHEVVRLLQSDGRLDNPEAVTSWSVEIPQGVRQVIGRRLSALPEECNRVLTIASVIGREFSLPVLALAGKLQNDALLDLLEEAEDARIISEVDGSPGTYRFSHALVRETLYEEIRTTRRVRMHRQVAEVLEAFHVDRLDAHLAELAYHFCEAASGGDIGKAVDYAVSAAERASAFLAFEEAANHYERALFALEAAEPVDEMRRCQLLLALGASQYQSGAPLKSKESFRLALASARALDEPELFARAATEEGNLETFSVSGIEDKEIAGLEEALVRLPDSDSAIRSLTLSRLASRLLWLNMGRASELSEQAVAMARRVGEFNTLSQTLYVHTFFLGNSHAVDERLAMAKEVVELSVQIGNREQEHTSRGTLMIQYIEIGDVEGVDREMAKYVRLSEELRQPFFLSWSSRHQATQALREGRLADARRLSFEAYTLGLRSNEEAAVQFFGLQLYMLRRLQGRFDEPGVEQTLRVGIERFPGITTWPALLAVQLAETGRGEDACRVVDEIAMNDFDTSKKAPSPAPHYLLAADACLAALYLQPAERLYELLSPWADRILSFGGSVSYGAAARGLGNLATMLKREDEAERHFEKALELETRMRAFGFLPRLQCDYARMLLSRDRGGDRERARELLDAALDTSQRLGLKGWLEECLETKLRSQGIESGSVSSKSTINVMADSLAHKPIDVSAHTASDGMVTLVFSDMEGFTTMTERLGDRRAHEVIQRHHRVVRRELERCEGRELELQGDGFLLSFPDPARGLRCSIAIQRGFVEHNLEHPEEPIRVRIGLHHGEAIAERGRFFGLTVILAARIASRARGGEILVSRALKLLTEGNSDFRFGAESEADLKGVSERQKLYPVKWEAEIPNSSEE
jgi:class 3 adenylate cyclase/tetratricopeptide (TPR) repeat protein